MCGIVGYIGKQQAYPILIKGLQRLEYRGYDSAGLALINANDELNVYKTKGKVANLEHFIEGKDSTGCVGIAHTRWATHGEPSQINAHPHYSKTKNIALIHNGIIENYADLKKKLQAKGIEFVSDTDTEVLVHLIEYIYQRDKSNMVTAAQVALNQVIGAYAIAIIDRNNPETLIVARKSSPLVIGIGDGEFFLASDASPIVEYTKQMIFLDNDEIAVINLKSGVKVKKLNNVEVTPEIKEVMLDVGQLEKGGYPHFMLKEIFEQPECLINCMKGRVNVDLNDVKLAAIIDNKQTLLNANRIVILACGTSWHSGLIGKYLIETFCKIPVDVEYASEFRYRNSVISPNDVVIAISQSGETADTLAAIELAREKGAFVYGICNAVGSSIPRVTHTGSYIHVGPEIGVASTKAFTGQVTVLTMFALALAKAKNIIAHDKFLEMIKELSLIPDKIREVLKHNDKIADLAKIFTYARNFIYLGRGYCFPVALEGALKLKEISYIHAEGYPAAEMKHGPIALIDEEMPVVFIATQNSLYEKVVSNMQEVKARKGRIIAIVNKGDHKLQELADYCIEVPATVDSLEPLITSIPLQLLAYHIAVCKGKNVDQPRNLAKSVTVE